MKKMKLLRDKRGHTGSAEHADYLANGGEPYRTVTAPDEIMNLLLVAKLHEEAEEIREDMTDVAEYADLLAVLLSLARRNGIAFVEIVTEMQAKRGIAGDFTQPRLLIKD
jgi:predicted house-cleaning noncanonical NTP pyrophosphatase (MazG superfamily)